ncbi:MAG: 16S rRNA (guanine(966)-N(2))-methyltransferase RsmD [Candidatus Omnitrophica bacterium]|jgi:16S rRNA (guanine(966)-N(2))-methyltransferase RsmD|nr:16S rRNA (guanine(966)-N(2))-methyltransferase RsmD [Candidatus Omnitrophota bacterium]
MRVISGIYKGRLISMPMGIRPTRDNVKEALFNVLASSVRDKRVLDLFAGSGALGIEALSRSAKETVFIDNSKACTDIIYDNITKLSAAGFSASIRIFTKDAFAGIRLLGGEGKKFDIIFADPPYYKDRASGSYHKNRIRKCLKYISMYDILGNSGLVFVEHFKKDIVPGNSGCLNLSRQLNYGDTTVSLYTKVETK